MFEETNRILNKIIEANILDDKDIATIERSLKFQEMEDIMLNECLFKPTDAKTNIFDFKYQVGQGFGKVEEKKKNPKYEEIIKKATKELFNEMKSPQVEPLPYEPGTLRQEG